jgi:hypothetical protein
MVTLSDQSSEAQLSMGKLLPPIALLHLCLLTSISHLRFLWLEMAKLPVLCNLASMDKRLSFEWHIVELVYQRMEQILLRSVPIPSFLPNPHPCLKF